MTGSQPSPTTEPATEEVSEDTPRNDGKPAQPTHRPGHGGGHWGHTPQWRASPAYPQSRPRRRSLRTHPAMTGPLLKGKTEWLDPQSCIILSILAIGNFVKRVISSASFTETPSGIFLLAKYGVKSDFLITSKVLPSSQNLTSYLYNWCSTCDKDSIKTYTP